MLRILAVVTVIWLALLPPLFTAGACTREFDAEAQRLEAERANYTTLDAARGYWSGRNVSYSVLSYEQCRKSRPRWLEVCGKGPLLHARVPVRNAVCSLYRDDEIRVQLQYDDRGRLERVQTDMNPFRSLPIPFLDYTIHWGR